MPLLSFTRIAPTIEVKILQEIRKIEIKEQHEIRYQKILKSLFPEDCNGKRDPKGGAKIN